MKNIKHKEDVIFRACITLFFGCLILGIYYLYSQKILSFCSFLGMFVALSFLWVGLIFSPETNSEDRSDEIKQNIIIYFVCPLLFVFISVHLIVFVPKFGNLSCFSKIDEWGAYATCLATITSFISVVLIYKTYQKQSIAYKNQTNAYNDQQQAIKEQSELAYKTKFDNLFVHLLQTQRELYQKTNPNIFYYLHKYVNMYVESHSCERDFRKLNSCLYSDFFKQQNTFSAVVFSQKNKFTYQDVNNLKNYLSIYIIL